MGAPSPDKYRELPEAKAVAEAGELLVKDKDGNDVPFKSFYTDTPAEQRSLVVFIRHFFCGNCEQYVHALVEALPPSQLSAHNTALTIIGCGEPLCISDYSARTKCPFPVYADPTMQLYKKLGMTYITLKPGSKPPGYFKKPFYRNAIDSFWNTVRSGYPLSAGPFNQNGGEWVFQNGQVTFCHRMRNTTDHMEVSELREVLGIAQ